MGMSMDEKTYKCHKCGHLIKTFNRPTTCPKCGYNHEEDNSGISLLDAFLIYEAVDAIMDMSASEKIAEPDDFVGAGGDFGGAGSSGEFESESNSDSGSGSDFSSDSGSSDSGSSDSGGGSD